MDHRHRAGGDPQGQRLPRSSAALSATTLRRTPPAPADYLAAGGLVALGAAFVLSPDHIEDGPVLCPFRGLTGIPCPGCGLTRAWVYAAHGWWRESLLANPFGLVAMGLVLALVASVVRARARRSPPPDLDRLVRTRWLAALLCGWLAFAVVRAVVSVAAG